MHVKEILKVKGQTLVSTTPDALVSDAVITMAKTDMGSVVVMEGEKMVGMLTFREIMRVLAKRQQEHRQGPTPPIADLRVRDLMFTDPQVVTPGMDLNELRQVMIESHQRYLPVVEGERLLGVISFIDVARAVLDEQGFENKMLKAYIRDWPAEV